MANVRISDLAEDTGPADGGLLEMASPSGPGYVSRRVTLASVYAYVAAKLNAAFDAMPLSLARGGTGGNTAATARTALGLGTIATQDASGVAITGGTVAGIVDLAVADGGTGASTAGVARSNLGAAAAGANSDITALTGLTTPLTIQQGGTGATTAAAARTTLQAFRIVQPSYVAGRWYWPFRAFAAGQTVTANTVRFTPFVVAQAVNVADLTAVVTTAASGGNLQAAIYAADATTNLPTGSAVIATGNLSTASATTVTGGLSASAALTPGLYWAAVNADNSTAGVLSDRLYDYGWLTGATTASALTGTAGVASISYAQTFGTWPNLTGASFAEATQNGPLIGFKVASVP